MTALVASCKLEKKSWGVKRRCRCIREFDGYIPTCGFPNKIGICPIYRGGLQSNEELSGILEAGKPSSMVLWTCPTDRRTCRQAATTFRPLRDRDPFGRLSIWHSQSSCSQSSPVSKYINSRMQDFSFWWGECYSQQRSKECVARTNHEAHCTQ